MKQDRKLKNEEREFYQRRSKCDNINVKQNIKSKKTLKGKTMGFICFFLKEHMLRNYSTMVLYTDNTRASDTTS